MTGAAMSQEKFGEVFRDRVTRIEDEAKRIGLNFTSICKEAGISRATPDRWRKESPKTIRLVEAMEKIIERHRAEYEAKKAEEAAEDE
jgi:hypothetical protein